jgi:hypothetical protein
MIFQRLDEINKKEKDKTTVTAATVVTVANRRPKPLEGVIWPVLQSSRGKLDRFIVEGVN